MKPVTHLVRTEYADDATDAWGDPFPGAGTVHVDEHPSLESARNDHEQNRNIRQVARSTLIHARTGDVIGCATRTDASPVREGAA